MWFFRVQVIRFFEASWRELGGKSQIFLQDAMIVLLPEIENTVLAIRQTGLCLTAFLGDNCQQKGQFPLDWPKRTVKTGDHVEVAGIYW